MTDENKNTVICKVNEAMNESVESLRAQNRFVCDFCGKKEGQVNLMIVGGKSTICDECTQLLGSIVDDHYNEN